MKNLKRTQIPEEMVMRLRAKDDIASERIFGGWGYQTLTELASQGLTELYLWYSETTGMWYVRFVFETKREAEEAVDLGMVEHAIAELPYTDDELLLKPDELLPEDAEVLVWMGPEDDAPFQEYVWN